MVVGVLSIIQSIKQIKYLLYFNHFNTFVYMYIYRNADTNQLDPDVFLLFTSSALYVSNYDESNETFIDYQKIMLKDVEKLELSPEFSKRSANSSLPKFCVLRLFYKITESNQDPNDPSCSGYFHMFRSSNLRFFNNLVITTNSSEQLTEALRGICHTIQSTANHFNFNINFEETSRLIRYKINFIYYLKQQQHLKNFIYLEKGQKYQLILFVSVVLVHDYRLISICKMKMQTKIP